MKEDLKNIALLCVLVAGLCLTLAVCGAIIFKFYQWVGI